MVYKGMEKQGPFTSLFYELTWPIGWEHILSFIDVIIKTDFSGSTGNGHVSAMSVGFIAGAEPVDVTEDLIAHGYEIKNTDFAKNESGFVILAGESGIMHIPMRFTLWNQLDRCLVQLMNDDKIDKEGEHVYDKYLNSIEIRGHMDYALANAKEPK